MVFDKYRKEDGIAIEEWNVIFDAIDDAIFVADTNNNIRKVNKSLAKLFNTIPEKIIGKKCYELMHRLKHPWPECPFEKTKADKKTHTEKVIDDNIGIPLLITTSPIFDGNGNLAGIVHVAKDMTEYDEIQKELKKKIDELERFNKVTIGRELRMKELKATIAQLEAKLGMKQAGS